MKASVILFILFLASAALLLAGNGMAFVPAIITWIAYDNSRQRESDETLEA